MKGSTPNGGYTIVEVLIFLAVSGLLFVSAMALLSGQQNKAQFQAAVKDVESRLQDTLNDVSTGYYRNTGNFKCDVSGVGGKPKITSAPPGAPQGNNKECISVGRIIQFSVNASGGGGADTGLYNIYDVVGRRRYTPPGGSEIEVDNVKAAKPEINYFTVDRLKLQAGMTIGSVKYTDATGNPVTDGAIGIFTSFGQTSSNGLESGALSASLVPLDGFYGKPEPSANGKLNQNVNQGLQYNPTSGITICFNSGTTSQHATITIGGQARQFSTATIIDDGSCT